MGKKRRLKSARAKFGNKNSSHPRMKTIIAMHSAKEIIEPVIEVFEAKEEPKVVETTPTPPASIIPELKEEPVPKPLLDKVELKAVPKLEQPAIPKPMATKVEVEKPPVVAAKTTKQATSKAKKPTKTTKKASKK